jgi:hypothetical protein
VVSANPGTSHAWRAYGPSSQQLSISPVQLSISSPSAIESSHCCGITETVSADGACWNAGPFALAAGSGPSRLSATNCPVEEGAPGRRGNCLYVGGDHFGQPRRPELKSAVVYAWTKFINRTPLKITRGLSSPRITSALQITCLRGDENSSRGTWTESNKIHVSNRIFSLFASNERNRGRGGEDGYSRRQGL